MKIIIAPPVAIWEQGNRKNQEDNIYPPEGKATEEDKLFILCDGMGGHERGEVASSLVCDSLSSYIWEHWDGKGFTDTILLDALNATMDDLDMLNDDSDKRPGTTLVVLISHDGGAFAAHIGDSRIYHIRPASHEILYKSRDHSQVYDMLASGEITVEEMKRYSKKNIITRALLPGLERRPKPSVVHIADIKPGDYFYLCSDGMLEQMSDAELVKLFRKDISDEKKAQLLINLTKDNQDNHSAYLIRISGVLSEENDDKLKDDEKESPANALNLERQAMRQVKHQTVKETKRSNKSGVFQHIKSFIKGLFK